MRVKVGNIWYSANDAPIAIELDDGDHTIVARMAKPPDGSSRRYAQYASELLTRKEAEDWLAE